MKTKVPLAFLLVGALLSTVTVCADEWSLPVPRVFGSPQGRHAFKVLNPKFDGPSQGVLFKLDDQGKDVILWDSMLVNTPHQVFVSGQKHVVTIDTYGNLGYQHALVIYDDKGKVVKDFKLEDLLTDDEIMKNVKRSESSRWWAEQAQFRYDGTNFVARLKWGKTISIDVNTGKIGK